MKFLRSTMIAVTLVAASLPAMAEGGGGGLGMRLIRPAPGTTFWTLVTFLLMAFILGKYAWKPLLGALEQRESSIRDSIDQAKLDREESEKLLAEHRNLVSESRRERADALARGRQDAERVKAELLQEAQLQREKMLKQTESQVQSAMRQARIDMRAEAVHLAVQAAEKLMAKNLDDATQRKLVEDYLADLERGIGPSSSPPS